MPTARPQPALPKPSIRELMDSFVDAERASRSKRHIQTTEQSLDLLRAALEGYGYQYLTTRELERWAAASAAEEESESGEAQIFCSTFGADALAKYLHEFFGYFLIRKVMFRAEEIESVIDDVRRFVGWLVSQRHLTPARGRKALARAALAADEVPDATRLASLLFTESEKSESLARRLRDAETVEDFLVIERVAPGRIWFEDIVGPVKVPEAASRLARTGWTVNIVLGRVGDRWHILEVGNVYPERLA